MSGAGARSLDRRIWHVAAPAILANVSGPMVGVVDTWALGHLPEARYLAAIAVGAFVFHFIYWSFGFLRMGTTGLVAQAHGAGDLVGLRRTVLRAALLGLGFSAFVLAAQGPLIAALFALLAPNPAEAGLAMLYCEIRIWSAPAILLRLTVIGWLIGVQRARLALLIELALNLANAAMTVLFVSLLGFGMAGAAYASLLAELLAAALAALVAVRLLGGRQLLVALREPAIRRVAPVLALLRVNAFLFGRTMLLLFAFAMMWRSGAALGTLALSTNQVLMQFVMITSFGLDGMAYAAEALVGAAKGARDRAALRAAALRTTVWAFGLAALYMAVWWIAGAATIDAFTDHESVREAARALLPWIVALPMISVWSYQLDGIFIGATETAAMMWTMAAALLLFLLLVALLVPAFGNAGLWSALAAFLAARGLGLALVYPRLERRAATG